MATYYFLNTGNNNWGVSTNWSTSSGGPGNGSVPTLSDDIIFDTNSGNCTVDTTNRECKSINFTNYGATISMTYVINTYGNVTLGASMGITGSAQLNVNETSNPISESTTSDDPKSLIVIATNTNLPVSKSSLSRELSKSSSTLINNQSTSNFIIFDMNLFILALFHLFSYWTQEKKT